MKDELLGHGALDSAEIIALSDMTKTEGWATFCKWLKDWYYELADDVLADGKDVNSARGSAMVIQQLFVDFKPSTKVLFEKMRKEIDKPAKK